MSLFLVCTFWKGIITGFDSVLDQSTLATTFQGIHGNCTSIAGIAHMQLVLSVYKSMLTGLTLRVLNEGGSTFNEGIYELSNLDNGKVLSLNNTEITTTDECAGADNQKWILDYVDNANFRLINAQTGMAVSLGSDNRSLVQEKIDVNSKKQIWQRVKSTAGANEYWLMNSMLGKDGTLFAQIDGEYDRK